MNGLYVEKKQNLVQKVIIQLTMKHRFLRTILDCRILTCCFSELHNFVYLVTFNANL